MIYYTITDSVIIESLGNKIARDIWESDRSNKLPKEIWARAKALMTIMHHTSTLNDLKLKGQPPNIRLHKLKGNRRDQWSVTVALPWCITFRFKDGLFSNVRIENYHKG